MSLITPLSIEQPLFHKANPLFKRKHPFPGSTPLSWKALHFSGKQPLFPESTPLFRKTITFLFPTTSFSVQCGDSDPCKYAVQN